MRFKGVIAALWRRVDDIPLDNVFLLRGTVDTISEEVEYYKNAGKRVFVDMDFVDGLGDGEYAVRFLRDFANVDGIITVKMKNYVIARKLGIPAVLRFFALDSRAVERGIAQIESNGVEIVEVLPGLAVFKVVKRLRKRNFNLIAAGLVDDREELLKILEVADAVSTSSSDLWYVDLR